MNDPLAKFPTTPHLAWLGSKPVREGKVLTPGEVAAFLHGPIIVEEKVDGANLGISVDQTGQLRFQNRGNWIEGKLTGQWERLRGWASGHQAALVSLLPPNHILFGEWCYATHSIKYDSLPDWFLAFDVYDRLAGRFWSVERRNTLVAAAGLHSVPQLARGIFPSWENLLPLLQGASRFTNAPREGIYVRREEGDWLAARAKVVRAEFTQAIVEHWSSRALKTNALQHPETSRIS